MSLFVGRDEEIKKYIVDVLSDQRALKIVSGDIGAGKTTFVNACQYYSYTQRLPFEFAFRVPRILPCIEKVQISDTDTTDSLVNKAIVSICQSVAYHCRLTDSEPPKQVKDILSFFLDLKIGVGGNGFTAGVNVMGTGGEFGRTKESMAPNTLRNPRAHLKQLVELIRDDLGFPGVFITVNNLDILTKSELVRLINASRDELFDIPGIYWTLIGRKGIASIIETEAGRVADYLSGLEQHISPFDFAGTKQVIGKRVETFRMKPNVECPLTDDSIRAFYFLSVQELRETLRICGEITRTVILKDPSLHIIPTEVANAAFVGYAHQRATELDVTELQKKVLMAVYERESCRPKDYAKFGFKTGPAFISALKGLVGKKLLSVEEQGRARIYRMTGMTMIAAITGALGREIQTAAADKFQTKAQIDDPEQDRFHSAQLNLHLDEQNGD